MEPERCLGKGVDAPELGTVKGFIRFLTSASRGLIVEKPTVDSINAYAEESFASLI